MLLSHFYRCIGSFSLLSKDQLLVLAFFDGLVMHYFTCKTKTQGTYVILTDSASAIFIIKLFGGRAHFLSQFAFYNCPNIIQSVAFVSSIHKRIHIFCLTSLIMEVNIQLNLS